MTKRKGMLKKILIPVGIAVAGIVAYKMIPQVRDFVDKILSKVGMK